MVVGAFILLCLGAIWFVAHRRANRIDTPAGLLSRLPAKDAVVLSIDFAALRRAGLIDMLARSKTPEEPAYQQFVAKTEFDYKQDLDLALASFGPKGKFFLLRGRFNWTSLSAYAKSENGSCFNTLCRMAGSTPERRISFFPVQPAIMALAVAAVPDAASWMMGPAADARQISPSADPVWISFTGSALRQQTSLPTGSQIFAQEMERADEVMLSLGPKGPDFQLTLAARCRSERDAALLQAELEHDTQMLRNLIARENRTPNPGDLSGTLTSGTFSHTDQRVWGYWPVAHKYIADTLSGGSL